MCIAYACQDAADDESAIFEAGPAKPNGKIDELVFGRLSQAHIEPANMSTDAVFLRRAFVDVTGTLPTADQAAAFLADQDPAKRTGLIEKLLASDDFVDYASMKWCDLLRVKAEFPINLWPNAAQAYSHWVRTALLHNKPYDQFVRELLTANGSNFRDAQVNFYRAIQSREPQAIAQAVALTFMGTRAEKWPQRRWNDMSVFFSEVGYKTTGEWKEEIIYWDATKRNSGLSQKPLAATLPDGLKVQIAPNVDPRRVLADWLCTGHNPWFAKNAVNRIWSWLMGRGIIHPPDDVRDDNPPQNAELLAYLEREFITSGFDLKHVYKLILNSTTYQLSSIPKSDRPDALKNFAAYPVRRLDAEVLIDALCKVTGTTEIYSSAVPEPYTIMPAEQRAVSLPDGSVTSSFLELFGRPSRDAGMEGERNNRPSASQRLHMLNSTHIQRKVEQSPRLQEIARGVKEPGDALKKLYLTILSRYPITGEMTLIGQFSKSKSPRESIVDLAWALINSSEFLYRH